MLKQFSQHQTDYKNFKEKESKVNCYCWDFRTIHNCLQYHSCTLMYSVTFLCYKWTQLYIYRSFPLSEIKLYWESTLGLQFVLNREVFLLCPQYRVSFIRGPLYCLDLCDVPMETIEVNGQPTGSFIMEDIHYSITQHKTHSHNNGRTFYFLFRQGEVVITWQTTIFVQKDLLTKHNDHRTAIYKIYRQNIQWQHARKLLRGDTCLYFKNFYLKNYVEYSLSSDCSHQIFVYNKPNIVWL